MKEQLETDRSPETNRSTQGTSEHVRLALFPVFYGAIFFFVATQFLTPLPIKRRSELAFGPASVFYQGKVEVKEFNGDRVFVLSEGREIVALKARCVHGFNVNWDQDSRMFKCPCDGTTFTRKGKHNEGPTRMNLTSQRFKIEKGTVVVLDDERI